VLRLRRRSRESLSFSANWKPLTTTAHPQMMKVQNKSHRKHLHPRSQQARNLSASQVPRLSLLHHRQLLCLLLPTTRARTHTSG
jgi:hypothetical protein